MATDDIPGSWFGWHVMTEECRESTSKLHWSDDGSDYTLCGIERPDWREATHDDLMGANGPFRTVRRTDDGRTCRRCIARLIRSVNVPIASR